MEDLTKSKINRAGDVLRNSKSSVVEINQALIILNSWRNKHKHPMNIFYRRLKKLSEGIDKTAISAPRLKRVSSIIKKLNRVYEGLKPTLKLSKMQDIAGCRVILSNNDLVKEFCNDYYINGDVKHSLKRMKDYISEPKIDGYRSIHLVYEYTSDKAGKLQHNGSLIEIQFRSQLQHVWATAVETVGLFTGVAIKSNEGTAEWINFFKLVSSAFAMIEKSPTIPGVTTNIKELYSLIKQKEKELDVKTKMKYWAHSLNHINNLKNKTNFHFALLQLDTKLGTLTINTYSKRLEQKALNDYAITEKNIYGLPQYDVVLVGADSISDLKKAYPNYFLDTKQFIKNLNKILNYKFE